MNIYPTKRGLVLALSCSVVPLACSDDNGDDVVAIIDAGDPDAGEVQSDGQIIAVTSIANAGEIAQGRYALAEANDARVRDYAQSMVSEHTAAQQRQDALLADQEIVPEDNQVSENLRAYSEANLLTLNTSPEGTRFDVVYLQTQIEMHEEVLGLLQATLIPAAKNSTLRDELDASVGIVRGHRDRAKEILDQIVEEDAGVTSDGEESSGDGGSGER